MGMDVELADQLRDQLLKARVDGDDFEVATLELALYIAEQRIKKECKRLVA